MSVADDLTPIQWEAVKATAAAHLRDPEELGRELRPLVYIDPHEPDVIADAEPVTGLLTDRTYSVDFTLSPENSDAVWSLLGTSDGGARVFFAPLATPMPTVNDTLTLPTVQEHTP